MARIRENTRQEPIRVLLLGSYNGQDSLGDECLLKSVVRQYRERLVDVEFVLHCDQTTPVTESLESEGVTSNPGLQTLFWTLRSQLRHTRLPVPVVGVVATLLFPLYFLALWTLNRRDVRRVVRQIRASDKLHVFGGTNFSRQWFWMNFPHYVATSVFARLGGARTVLSPQQIGPMTGWQRFLFRIWLTLLVDDYRVRNLSCVNEVGLDPLKYTCDEVFSNRRLYPIVETRPDESSKLLVNVRGGPMTDESGYQTRELAGLAQLLKALHRQLDLPLVFFSVSGESFYDDNRTYESIASLLEATPHSNAGRVDTDADLFRLAEESYACVSMSFHGCILCTVRGIPAVPLVDGFYYEHKYSDFDIYGDGQPVPLIRLADATASVNPVLDYMRNFDASAAALGRTEACRLVERFYDQTVSDWVSG